jgi:hypothetical protein
MIRITHAQYLTEHRVYVRFSDGTEGRADFAPLLKRKALARLRDPEAFAQLFVDDGAIYWQGPDVDVANEAVYALVHGLKHPETLAEADANELAMSLRELREFVGKSQTEVGRALLGDQSTLSRFERETDHKISSLRRFCDALGAELEIAAIFEGKRFIIRGA